MIVPTSSGICSKAGDAFSGCLYDQEEEEDEDKSILSFVIRIPMSAIRDGGLLLLLLLLLLSFESVLREDKTSNDDFLGEPS